ncbi:MAG: hypothetical protein WDM86_18430 [Rhizomicrobium sp.]
MVHAQQKSADDLTILRAMLEKAEHLCRCDDGLLAGQYEHLRERIRALIELHMPLDLKKD